MKSLILILFIVGLVLVVIGYTENYKKCELPKVEYRYIPRNFYEEQVTEHNLKNVYSDMFNKSDTWHTYANNIDENYNIPLSNEFGIDPNLIIDTEIECIICLSNKAQVSLNCGHECICYKCVYDLIDYDSKNNKKSICPICRVTIDTISLNYTLVYNV